MSLFMIQRLPYRIRVSLYRLRNDDIIVYRFTPKIGREMIFLFTYRGICLLVVELPCMIMMRPYYQTPLDHPLSSWYSVRTHVVTFGLFNQTSNYCDVLPHPKPHSTIDNGCYFDRGVSGTPNKVTNQPRQWKTIHITIVTT